MKKICVLCFTLSVAITRCVAHDQNDLSLFGVFVGTSPCHSLIRPLLHIPEKGNCDQVKWELTLYQDTKTGEPSSYVIRSEYEIYTSNSTSEKKLLPVAEGRWAIQKDLAAYPGSVFYTLDPGKPETTLSFVRLDDNIIHVANSDKSLMIGDGGQSYSLNRKDPKPVASVTQTLPVNTVDQSVTQIVFQGRTPCQEIARAAAIPVAGDCFKLKWLLTLNYNSTTHAPSTFSLGRTGHRESAIMGTWTILHGTKTDPQAIVYKLNSGRPEETLYLLQADRHVLFFMDKEMHLLAGNQDFDYTLNLKSKQSLQEDPSKSFTKTEASKILGEDAKVLRCVTEQRDDLEKYTCTYTAADPDTTVVRHLDFIFERYKDTVLAQKTYRDMVSSNRGMAGQEKIAMGDEAWFHTDGINFCMLMVSKDNKVVRVKINKLTSKTSIPALKDIIRKLVTTL